MKKNLSRNKFNLLYVFILGLCLSFASSITTFADTNSVTQAQRTDIESVLLQKQQEIDKYLFEQHAKEIEEKGIKVTHTGPMKDYVEIGITPFNKENANYLYSIFGNDKVKVVEGQQAVLMNSAVSAANTTVAASTTGVETTTSTKTSGPGPLIYAVVGAVVIGVIGFVAQKRKIVR